MPLKQLDYAGPEGLPGLREELPHGLVSKQGHCCKSRDIFIMAGFQHMHCT